MIKFKCDKLGRDKSLARLSAQGVVSHHRMIQGDELRFALKKKLVEEALEVAEAIDLQEIISELADVLEVIDGIYKAFDINPQDVAQAKEHKFQERGGFYDGFYLESIEMDENHKRIAYYKAAPHKYPEEK